MNFIKSKNNKAHKGMRTIPILILIFLIGSVAIAQPTKKLIEQAELAMKDKNYYFAEQLYSQILLRDSSKLEFMYKHAEASRLNLDILVADYWYKKVYNLDKENKFPETAFRLASILKSEGKYDEAKAMFIAFETKNKTNKDPKLKQLVARTKAEIEACDFSKQLIANPLGYNVEHLDTSINSKLSEYAPIELDTTLYFSSLRIASDKDKENNVNYNKLFLAHQNNRVFTKAEELDTLFNENGIHNANTCFNQSFTRIYISRCKQINSSNFQCEILESSFKDNKWSKFKKLPAQINQNGSNNTQPNIGIISGQEYLFFSSNRKGGIGGQDIWYSKINKDGTYGEAVNAGKKVNTPEDEITPFYVEELEQLFFSSTYHKGMGGYDIFKSNFKNNEFLEPENAGYPINSPLNDIYFTINSKKNIAYLSSNRAGSYFEIKQSCCNDIFRFTMEKLVKKDEITVVEKKVREDSSSSFLNEFKVILPLTLYFHNDEPNPNTNNTKSNLNYKTTYDEYKKLYNDYYREYPKNLIGTEKEKAINQLNTYFKDSVDGGMINLDKFSSILTTVMNKNQKVKITLKGFCSPRSSTKYNINLAKRRISCVENYFSEYNNGLFKKYINNKNPNEGGIQFIEEEIGELPTSTVSDDFNDERNSIYSPFAGLERKIKVLSIDLIK
jgi:hypothetical protein